MTIRNKCRYTTQLILPINAELFSKESMLFAQSNSQKRVGQFMNKLYFKLNSGVSFLFGLMADLTWPKTRSMYLLAGSSPFLPSKCSF